MYQVYVSNTFEKEVRKELSFAQRVQLDVIFDKLMLNPFLGDSLKPEYFREVRLQTKRVYFVIDGNRVLLIGVSDKRTQQKRITAIRVALYSWLIYLRSL